MKWFAIKYGTGEDLGRPSHDEQKIRRAYSEIEPHLRERCEVVELTDDTVESIVAAWLREQIADRIATCGYTEDVIAFERALELLTVGPFPDIEAAKSEHQERMRRIGEMLADPASPTLRPPRDELETLTEVKP